MKGLQALVHKLREKKWTLSLAESCTGGLLSANFTEHSGISDLFLGSVVCYSNQVKFDVLGVTQESCLQFGAVSEAVALQMVQGSHRVLKSDCAMAITGIAGPSGGTPEKPVGTVCIAVHGPGFETSVKELFFGDRRQIQIQACEYAIDFLLKEISAC